VGGGILKERSEDGAAAASKNERKCIRSQDSTIETLY